MSVLKVLTVTEGAVGGGARVLRCKQLPDVRKVLGALVGTGWCFANA